MQKHSGVIDPAKADIASAIEEIIKHLFDSKVPESEQLNIYQFIEKPPESSMGDFALPCFRFAKIFRENPNEIAKKIKLYWEKHVSNRWVKEIETKGAFLNFYFDYKQLAEHVLPLVKEGTLFQLPSNKDLEKTKVMVEFSQPNTHKEFHVGHCRNVCLGDSICRILEYSGFDVTPVNYIGDEGTHVAKCLWSVERYSGLKPEKNFSEWYGKRYSETHEKLEQAQGELKTAMQGEISHILSCLESKSGKYFQMWQQSRKQCLEDFDHIYEWLNVPFSHIFYESEVSEESQAIVEEYINKGLFTKSDGAYGVSLEPYGLGYFMARKSDGTSLYITKDLALAKTKFEKFNIDRSIYVVGSEQNFHFRQLFKTLELMGFQQAKQCFHLSYAHVTLPEGKISSRRGNAIPFWKLASLLESEFDVHLEKYVDVWPKTELESTRKKLAIAAIKYGMLSADPQKEIVFDPKIWTSFDGNSGAYLMYTYARTSSILKECMQRGYQANFSNFELLTEQYEYEILRHIYDFNGVVRHSGETYKPSVIANYLFSLCKSFNRFYANLSVLKADDDRVRDVRMALLIGFSETLKEGLKLLGIPTVDRM